MQKTLKTLLRVKDSEMTALRKEGYRLQQQLQTLEIALKSLHQDRALEIQMAKENPILKEQLLAYMDVSSKKIERLDAGLAKARALLAAHQDKMHEKFTQMKTFEQALENQLEEERLSRLHDEQNDLDELAQARFFTQKE